MPTPREELTIRRELAAGNLSPRRELELRRQLSDIPTQGVSPFNTAAQPFVGFNMGLADVIDLPQRVGTAITNPVRELVGLEPAPIDQTSPITDALRSGAETFPATTGVERGLRRVGQEFGATAPIAALPFVGASGRAAQTAANVGTRGFQAFLNTVRSTPGRAAVGETIATAGAGTGAAIANELAPGSQGAEIAGQLIGGVSPAALATTPTSLAVRAGRNVASRFSEDAMRTRAQDQAREVIGGNLTQEATQNLNQADDVTREIPGFDPTLAERTGSPGLTATQRRIEAQSSGADLEAVAARRRANEAAINRFGQVRGPLGEDAPEFVIDTAARRVDDLRSTVERQQARTAGQRQDLAESLQPTDRAAQGRGLRDTLFEARSRSSQEMTALAERLGINDADVTAEFTNARQRIEQAFAPGSVFEDRANAPAVLQAIRNAPEQVTFQDLKALRERIGDDLMDAETSANPSSKKIRTLSTLQRMVDSVIDDLTRTADPDLADRYRQFRTTYFNDHVARFNQGPAFRVRQKDGRGFFRIADEKVAQAFFAPGDVRSARQFRAVFGDNPDANSAIQAVAMDSLRNGVVRDGVINPRALENWVRKHRSVLDEFPEIDALVRDVASADESLRARQTQLRARTQTIENQAITKELTAFGRATKTSGSVIDAAIREPRKMAQLAGRLKRNPDALAGLRRNVWNRAISGSSEDILRFMNDNAGSLRVLFGGRHFRDIETIAAARAMLERVPSPTGAAFQPRPLEGVERAIGQGLPQLSSRLFAARTGRVGRGYLAVDTFLRGIRGRAAVDADDLLREALYDSQVARDMAEAVRVGEVKPDVAKRLGARLFNLGQPFEFSDEQQRP